MNSGEKVPAQNTLQRRIKLALTCRISLFLLGLPDSLEKTIAGEDDMMGRLDDRQQPLFYDFCLEDHVPQDHLLRRVAVVLDLSGVRKQLAPYY
ncbi:MAG: hypothetical protein ACREC0_09425, partial [Methylocella sp.]